MPSKFYHILYSQKIIEKWSRYLWRSFFLGWFLAQSTVLKIVFLHTGQNIKKTNHCVVEVELMCPFNIWLAVVCWDTAGLRCISKSLNGKDEEKYQSLYNMWWITSFLCYRKIAGICVTKLTDIQTVHMPNASLCFHFEIFDDLSL